MIFDANSSIVRGKEVKTKNTYEASFYIMWGGKLENVRKLLLNRRVAKKKGFVTQWVLTISNVPNWAIETWRNSEAYGSITKFVDVRTKLKKDIKRAVTSSFRDS